MITITDGKKEFVIDKKYLKKVEGNYFAERKDWLIELEFVIKNENITMIRKRLVSSDVYGGDILSKYVNKVKSSNEIVLKKKEFDEISRLLEKFKEKNHYRKDVVIESYSKLIAYECYMTYSVCELYDVPLNEIYKAVCDCYCCYYRDDKIKYKKDILKKAEEILKKEYKVNLDYIFRRMY